MDLTAAKLVYHQSAVIPVRRHAKGQWQVLMITSRKRRRWIFPKGMVEPKMKPRDSAAKEALEEAGVKGRVDKVALGSYRIKKRRGVCEVEIYALYVDKILKKWQEDFRKRRWVDLADAPKKVGESGFLPSLKALSNRLSSRSH
ncbi:NUDIX hydrolase [Magnetococcus sp. PR-3]|uniref:NUDIX hydrolase n=1 Tax=Magnetococcus sp. PR-3 TaxID=3120355 RepID=UPI002FCE1C5B